MCCHSSISDVTIFSADNIPDALKDTCDGNRNVIHVCVANAVPTQAHEGGTRPTPTTGMSIKLSQEVVLGGCLEEDDSFECVSFQAQVVQAVQAAVVLVFEK